MREEMKIAVLGLGLMGAAVTFRLKARGMDVVGWNRSAAKAWELGAQGGCDAQVGAGGHPRAQVRGRDSAVIRQPTTT